MLSAMHTATPSISPFASIPELPAHETRWIPFPLTLRGILVAGVIVYGLLGPARLEADIIAATVGFTAAALFTTLLLITSVCAIGLRRAVRLGLGGVGASEKHEAGRPSTIVLKLPEFSILPGFVLSLQPIFNSASLSLPEFRLTGAANGPRYLSHQISFPHRGVWTLQEVRVSFGDQLGLSQLRWRLVGEAVERHFRVHPPRCEISQMPVVSSFERPGDLIAQSQERHGDPLDIRRYEPSDGTRRIVWKIFARKGELVSRHPEASMSPEGRVVMFCPALATEDAICSAMLQYAQQLTELNLEIVAGCSGMRAAPLAKTPEALEELLIRSVWSADLPTDETRAELGEVLARAVQESSGDRLHRVVLFTSSLRFRTARDRELMLELAATLQQQRITPTFFVYDTGNDGGALGSEQPRYTKRTPGGISQFVRVWFTDITATQGTEDAREYRTFLNTCAQHNFEVVLLRTA
ncbi:MAG: DUF58 domain-containing protein [Proteobacteria bacterium]|nr:DUF58 domain-containing protein [Pseudomonadota bacterium]